MRLVLLNPAAAALALALAFSAVVSAQISQECVHKCDVQRATEIATAVKAYPDYKDPKRLEAIDAAQDKYFDVCNYNLIAVNMKSSLTSTLFFAVCAMAALSSTEAKTPSVACRDLCTSFSVGECVKKYSPITSNAGVKCINEAVLPYTGACKDECMKQLRVCDDNCFVVMGPNWESCVDQYTDPKDPKRIQCIKDVEEPLRGCRLSC
ncbi:hypothetical protein BGZ75_010116 [Mortierella antarctica]|nr:hypothetical protein BGZ67_003798 [Mortierella alpina]KAF9978218.1 hypothetical protein BGZ75_010116 [Mortierella antarctica]